MRIIPNLFEIPASKSLDSSAAIVNVASVPKLSPFRYPGGKTWLIPEIRSWLKGLRQKPGIFIEPFAGGGIASLIVAFENLASKIIMGELDENVAAVWKVILQDADWLINRILTFEISLVKVQEILSSSPSCLREKAFQTVLRNRVQRGGIMAPGASLMKSGENGKGISSRWYAKTLAKRIQDIYRKRDTITFIQGDAFDLIGDYLNDDTVAFFIDPPYTAGGKRAGKRLYLYNEINHNNLFLQMARARGEFLMTYDDAEEVEKMALENCFCIKRVPMKNTHHNRLFELLITPNRHLII